MPGLETVSAVLNVLELLASSPRGMRLTEISRALDLSKPRVHRHLRALVDRGYAMQDAEGERYQIGIKLFVLGEAVRDRFDIVPVARDEMLQLRQATGQAVTLSALVDEQVVVLELLQGGTLIEFGIRPGARLPLFASAHGYAMLAFGPAALLEHAPADPDGALATRVARVRDQGWATAADEVLVGINALAAPLFDHRNGLAGTIAIVGSSQFIKGRPDERQIATVTAAAARISRQLGWRQN